MIYVNNDNDLRLSRLRLESRPNDIIEDAEFTLTVCIHNQLVVTNIVSDETDTVITLSAAHGMKVGDRILVNRLIGPKSANGKHTITAVTETTVTFAADISEDDPWEAPSGGVYRIIKNGGDDGDETVNFVWDDVSGYYIATVLAGTELIPRMRYLMFIEEPNLSIQQEFTDLAQVRAR